MPFNTSRAKRASTSTTLPASSGPSSGTVSPDNTDTSTSSSATSSPSTSLNNTSSDNRDKANSASQKVPSVFKRVSNKLRSLLSPERTSIAELASSDTVASLAATPTQTSNPQHPVALVDPIAPAPKRIKFRLITSKSKVVAPVTQAEETDEEDAEPLSALDVAKAHKLARDMRAGRAPVKSNAQECNTETTERKDIIVAPAQSNSASPTMASNNTSHAETQAREDIDNMNKAIVEELAKYHIEKGTFNGAAVALGIEQSDITEPIMKEATTLAKHNELVKAKEERFALVEKNKNIALSLTAAKKHNPTMTGPKDGIQKKTLSKKRILAPSGENLIRGSGSPRSRRSPSLSRVRNKATVTKSNKGIDNRDHNKLTVGHYSPPKIAEAEEIHPHKVGNIDHYSPPRNATPSSTIRPSNNGTKRKRSSNDEEENSETAFSNTRVSAPPPTKKHKTKQQELDAKVAELLKSTGFVYKEKVVPSSNNASATITPATKLVNESKVALSNNTAPIDPNLRWPTEDIKKAIEREVRPLLVKRLQREGFWDLEWVQAITKPSPPK